MKKVGKYLISLNRYNLLLIGVGLSVLFWILESTVHIVVFRDTSLVKQLYSPEPHEVWMRLIVVSMFISFGIYSQWIVAARRRAEDAAKLAGAELNQIFETAADGMRVIDKEYNVLRANKTFLTLSGMSREETIGKKCYEGFRGTECKTDRCPLNQILNNGGRIESDSEKIRKDGSIIPCIVTATPFRSPGGEFVGIVEDFKDISERIKSEQELRKSHERLRDLATHLQVVREEERGRIAREIHDELGQALTALKMDVHWLSHRCPKEEQSINKKLNAMSTVIDNTVRVVKRISSELRPILLDDFGLSAAIEWYAEEFSERTGIECHIVSDPEEIILDQACSIAIFRIFQESLTNVARHADASEVNVSLKKNSSNFEMIIHDNGSGITNKDMSNPRSFGLTGMRERVHYLKGEINIYGIELQGTTVEINLPIGELE